MRAERLQLLLNYINRQNVVSFADLCREFGVSSATMRRDLNELVGRGQIERMHGGARSLIDKQEYEPPYSDRSTMHLQEKRRIAQHALSLIQDGDSIVLDSSTTVVELAKLLSASTLNITVITNDMEIAYILAPHKVIELFTVGGYIRKGYYTSMGMFAENVWKELHADKLFLGVDAVNARVGMMNYRIEELSCKRLMLDCTKEHIVLCDHSKFESSAVLQICPLDTIDLVVTGEELDPTLLDAYRHTPLQIHRV